MAIFRNVNMSFWTDTKVVDDYTPEDRYFMLYALTNNYTNIIGCYEISIKQMSNDLGYNKDVVENLIKRFKETHKTIDYDFNTKELWVKNWSKYNWSASPKLDTPLYEAIESVKSDLFHDELAVLYNDRESVKENMVSIPYRYDIDTTITITSTITNAITDTISNNNTIAKEENYNDSYKLIIDSLNQMAGTNYKHTSKATQRHIKARLNEGFTIEDFMIVIKKKGMDWLKDNKMKQYLRPETLFGTKFESYLNQPMKEITTKDLTPYMDFSDFREEKGIIELDF